MANIGIIKFQLADTQFGIFADRILEIVRLAEFRRIPGPLPYVAGLTELRQYIVTVVDLRKRFGLSPIPLERGTIVIAMKISSGMIGVLVESISHFRPIPPEQILPPISIAGFPAKLLHGVVADDDDILILPDFDRIFSSYIHVHLLPITSSEKIAFQYRSTQGAITRTLENTLVSEGFLDETIIRKLPRAMELSSVYVHKVTSYYPHFRPRANTLSYEQPATQAQTVKAGDETYSSLSKRLNDREHSTNPYGERTPDTFTIRPSMGKVLRSRSSEAVSGRLGETLHLAESFILSTLSGQPIAPQELLANPEVGKTFAKTLRISPVSLTKFLTYYEQQSPFTQVPERRTLPMMARSSQSARRLVFPLEEQLEVFKRQEISLGEVLRALNGAKCVLNRQHIQWLATQYKVSLVKIAKLRLYFPDITFTLDDSSEEAVSSESVPSTALQAEHHTAAQDQHHRNERFFTTHVPGKKMSAEAVSRGFQHLLRHKKLPDDHAVRYVAAQLRIPTCRLSRMRSYYRMQ